MKVDSAASRPSPNLLRHDAQIADAEEPVARRGRKHRGKAISRRNDWNDFCWPRRNARIGSDDRVIRCRLSRRCSAQRTSSDSSPMNTNSKLTVSRLIALPSR